MFPDCRPVGTLLNPPLTGADIPFYGYKTVVNREKINERTEVVVLLKHKKL